MLEKDLLDEMAKAKAEIQSSQLWVDDARTNRIARIRYNQAKERLRELVTEVDGVGQDESGQRTNQARRNQVLNSTLRLVADPVVDGDAGLFRRADKVKHS